MPRFAIQVTEPDGQIKYVCDAYGELSDNLNDAQLSSLYRLADCYIDILREKYPNSHFKIIAINLTIDDSFDYIND